MIIKFNAFFCGITLLSFIMSNTLYAQIDKNATKETKALYENLRPDEREGIIFGAQTTTSMGIGWTTRESKPLQSDVKKVAGDFLGVFGFEFKKWNFNLDKGWMTDLEQVKEIYRRGGIVTISWHTDNPVTGGSCKDTTKGSLRDILPGGSRNLLFNIWLDSIAKFAHSAKVDGVYDNHFPKAIGKKLNRLIEEA
jgi:hypothetical protein